MRLSPLTQAVALMTATLLLTACGDDSETSTAIIDGTPPLLTTDSNFTSGYSATAAVFVSGQVQDSSSGIKSLTYKRNDGLAQPLRVDSDGYFDDRILLGLGENKVTLEATDNADNIMRLTKTIYVGDTIAAGGSHTAAIRDIKINNNKIDSSQLYGWGRNNFGQTGSNYTSTLADSMGHPETPMQINNAPKNLVSIKFNQNHSLAIAQDGHVYSWGEDKTGQLGRGDNGRVDCTKSKNDCRLEMGVIAGIEKAVMIAAGYSHSLVLTEDNSVWAFGANGQGQLGNAQITASHSSAPVKVDFSAATGIGHIIQVVASSNSSYALDDKGQVWGWGSNAYANFGRGQECNKANNCININPTPILIDVLATKRHAATADVNPSHAVKTADEIAVVEKVTQLAAGKDHVLALTNKESVYGWGLNASSQIGYNGIGFKNTANAWASTITKPTKLPWFTGKDVRRVYANGNASYVLLDNGKVYPWGMFGETNGAGKTVYNDLNEPTDTLPSLNNIDNMAIGTMHLIAQEKPDSQDNSRRFENGHLFTWGWSFEGSLGNSNAAPTWMYNYPIPIILPSQS